MLKTPIKKEKKHITQGILNIKTTFNNTIISLSDNAGNVLCWGSAGTVGFKGSRKNTPFAAQCVAKHLINKSNDLGIKTLNINIKGRGAAREAVLNVFLLEKFKILTINDLTPLAHNGCRPPKKRRI